MSELAIVLVLLLLVVVFRMGHAMGYSAAVNDHFHEGRFK